MNIFLFLIAIISTTLLIYYYSRFEKLKEETRKLAKDFSQMMDDQEAFSVELEKSNTELATKPTDSLTGLPGRPAFDDRLRQAMGQSVRFQNSFAVVALDIDDFSRIDQDAPPGTREEILVQVSERIQAGIRLVDSATRYAGSHFVILLPQLSKPETAAYVASRIQENILQPIVANGQEFHLTACLGIAIYPLDGDNVEALLQKANAALNEAKREGKNRYYFWHREIHALSERESQIFVVLRAPDLFSHLAVRYTPQVTSDTSRMTGIHASPSLLHSTLGEIASPEFMKLAEHCGRATEIMEWVFRQAIEEAHLCHHQQDLPFTLALSVSSRQLENSHFIFQLAQVAKEIDHQVMQPVFEITDSPSRAQPSLIRQGLDTLSEAGVRFAIQLFAVGHNLLQKFPSIQFTYMKMDINLVNSTIAQPEGESILSSMMTLTRNAGMEVIVEGVDEEGQKQRLQELGFHKLQGRLFTYLLPEKEVAEIPG